MPFLSPDLGVGLHRRAEFVKTLRGIYVRGEQCCLYATSIKSS